MSEDSFRFTARWSAWVWIMTVGVVLVVIGAEVFLVWKANAASDKAIQSLLILAALVPLAVLGATAMFAPWGYLIRPDGIVIRRLVSALVIPWGQIRDVRHIEASEIGFAWRTFGSGGFFGSFGWFYSRGLGDFRAYATNQRDLVLITRAERAKIVISPYPWDAFLEAVQGNRSQPV